MALQTFTTALEAKDQAARLELDMELYPSRLTTRPMDKGVTLTSAWTMVVYSMPTKQNYSLNGEHSERRKRSTLEISPCALSQ